MPELVTAPSFREQVLVHLRERIISGNLGPGALLTPSVVAKSLNTSAMPVREALRTLEQEGLVEVSGRRYTRVATPSRAVADEAYPLLALLEGHVIRQGEALPKSALARAERANTAVMRAGSTAEHTRAMFGFHREICSTAGQITRATLEMLYARIGLLESVYARKYEPELASSKHAEIVDALRIGDSGRAATLVERHWQDGYAAVLAFVDDAADASDIGDATA